MIFYLISNYLDNNELEELWKEEYDYQNIETLEQAEEWGKKTIEQFNASLRPGERPRKYIGIEEISQLTRKHDWKKTNLVTIRGRDGMYDTYRCDNCGITGKRYGIGESIHHDSRFKAEKYALCDPERKNHAN